MSELVRDTILFVVLILGLLGIAGVLAWKSCHLRWEGSGHQVSWELGAGCRLHVDGKWIPEKNYRNFGD